jgi:small-conductance mechanosensitive channel
MGRAEKLAVAVLATLLAATLVMLWWTSGARSLPAVAPSAGLDRKLLDTTRQLAPLAETPAEDELWREAVRLADHEMDQAFASAIREAAAARPAASGPLQEIQARIKQASGRVAATQARMASLPKENEAQIALAQAQLALDQDELEDAQADLEREGGDPRAELQRALAEHQAAQKTKSVAKPVSAGSTNTLGEQVGTWWVLSDRASQVAEARRQAALRTGALIREHSSLEALIAQKPATAAPSEEDADTDETEEDATAMLARLRKLSDQRKTLAELDRRIQDCQQLAAVYKKWTALIRTRAAAVERLILHSAALIFGVLLAGVFMEIAATRTFRDRKDRRRGHQQRFVISIGVRLAVLGVVLVIIFGPPSQTPTIIGLETAGLTVVLKDFVVAFIGWFVLMGRNGVRIGDWVEIQGVGGEVIEVGLFKTVLLEMGNWSNTGHPTGRRVSFMNGYAIEGHWFNFSTAGQWLWDEMQVAIPAGVDPYRTAQRIREVVEKETEANAELAEQDWERITRQYGTRTFSAKPSVELRPGSNGLEAHIRYITRGPQRYEVKSRLFRGIVELLATNQGAAKDASHGS